MYPRICPQCGHEVIHKNQREQQMAMNESRICRKCASSRRWTTEARKIVSDKRKGHRLSNTALEKAAQFHRSCTGNKNLMFGKSVDSLWKEKYGEDEASRLRVDVNSKIGRPWNPIRRKAHSDLMTSSNPMAGRSFYSVWLSKFGKEEADLRLSKFKGKQSLDSSGSSNPMFGKPSPIGSGCGWSGWYKGHYFRSLLELSYMLKFDKEGVVWKTAEKKCYGISYQTSTGTKTFFADFFLPITGEFIEIKPKALTYTAGNKAKFAAAQAVLGDKFKVLTEEDNPQKVSNDRLKELVRTEEVKLLPKWQLRL
jgi:hypothetical protein